MAARNRRTPGRLVQISDEEWTALMELAKERRTTASAIIRDAVRAILVAYDRIPAQPAPIDVMGMIDVKAPEPTPTKKAKR